MRVPYPDIHPYHEFQLQVSDLHSLYVEESGNPKGIPVVFIHGGPGAVQRLLTAASSIRKNTASFYSINAAVVGQRPIPH